MATKDDLREEIRQLRDVGRQMANLCFNLGQHHEHHDSYSIDHRTMNTMHRLQVEWDAIKRTERVKR
jgi:fatty acid desaturase